MILFVRSYSQKKWTGFKIIYKIIKMGFLDAYTCKYVSQLESVYIDN